MNKLTTFSTMLGLVFLLSGTALAEPKVDTSDLPPPPDGTQAEAEPVTDEKALENLMLEVLQVYLEIQNYLAEDSTWRVGRSAGLIALKAKNFNLKLVPEDFNPMYRTLPKKLRVSARKMYKAKSLADLRLAFKALSKPMATWANLSKPVGIDVIYCPVANATWLQNKGPTKNPYYGSQMLTSGQIVWSGTSIAELEKAQEEANAAKAAGSEEE
ncbi:MAG: DUF3347 domain-containing protein [Deltaproteobacteria bacterium]|jgi:hypothetical protein|nr:DUF3347 domain-containing protein [Deltaproteobacteria bacterium]MBT6433925.1 DUF3347 domain-containing protein [Deltaproteobacteria bacterium]MBT6491504.1 DUF3347 domain-containing protein [Deltaproteobacteria bacterium]